MSPTIGIYQSVGIGPKNNRNDVILVQSLINQALPRLKEAQIPFENFNPLVEDGNLGHFTKNATAIFQRDVIGLSEPDGRIDPGGRTIRSLYTAAYGDPKRIVPRIRGIRQAPVIHAKNGVSTESGAKAINLAAARQLLGLSQIRGMLDTIAYSEGSRRDRGGKEYGTIVHGKITQAPFNPDWVGKRSENLEITNFSYYPNLLVLWRESQPNDSYSYSSAAGRYQFLRKTWTWIAGFGLGDFSPNSQDLAAVMLMQYRGMITPLLAGNFDQAVGNGSREWASLPKTGGGGSYVGQRAHSLETLRREYQKALEKLTR